MLGEGEDAIRAPTDLYRDEGEYVYSNCFEESSTCRFSSPFNGSRWVDLRGALRVSSDTYFYEIGGEGFWLRPQEPDADGYLQDEGIQKWARALGLGVDSGIQLPYERAGAVPDRAYYDAQYDLGVFAVDSECEGGPGSACVAAGLAVAAMRSPSGALAVALPAPLSAAFS